ncbi:hypothetical protein PhCBS80983_g03166 [Powellomyces hirtus]|uniref:Uncharacterized protein n=1 Tax=Powellomyces hirtus TaxID=109895 RepID=A0A507E521_9FUNG|nr:hypothetical protein PhCBS80983_g03166 [Powellomyces hirtus]
MLSPLIPLLRRAAAAATPPQRLPLSLHRTNNLRSLPPPTPKSSPNRLHSTTTTDIPVPTSPYPAPLPTHTPTPPAKGLRLILRRTREGFAFVGKFKKTLLELFLWMVCGSLALELKWMRRDFEEYKETMGVRGRKLEAEIAMVKRQCGAAEPEPKEDVSVQKAVQRKVPPQQPAVGDAKQGSAPVKRIAIY